MQTRVRSLHTRTADGETSIVLEMSHAEGGPGRANLNAWLSKRASVNVRSAGASRSSASSQSKCGTDNANASSTGRASVQGATSEMSEED